MHLSFYGKLLSKGSRYKCSSKFIVIPDTFIVGEHADIMFALLRKWILIWYVDFVILDISGFGLFEFQVKLGFKHTSLGSCETCKEE